MAFVPEGRHDSSQARSAWNHEENRPVPAGRLNRSQLRSDASEKTYKKHVLAFEMPEYKRAMANTFCSLNIHYIFSTKERAPMLNPEPRERLWPFLGGIAKQNGITPRCIGGVADHVHLLLLPRHSVPGYYQPVPPGQKPFTHRSATRPERIVEAALGLGGRIDV